MSFWKIEVPYPIMIHKTWDHYIGNFLGFYVGAAMCGTDAYPRDKNLVIKM